MHRVLIEAIYQITKPLTILFNKSLNSGRVPDIWKLKNISLIQTKEDKSLSINYIPTSFTYVVGKLMETMVWDKLVTFLKENIKINNYQHGFNNSCLTNLFDFYINVFNIYDKTKAVDV